jgi:DNA invertase Pin-like site-specific DNA recombinase
MLTIDSEYAILQPMKTACAYYRTSSATNVGADKDSLKRQQDAVRGYASANGIEIVKEYYDAAVSGADMIDSRPGFSDMLEYMLGNGARAILVENAGRFARDAIVALTGHEYLKKQGIDLIPVDAPTHFTDDSPTATMIRTILAAVSAFEKDALVARLRKARERKRRDTGRCEGNPAWIPVTANVADMARGYHAQGLSLRQVSAKLAAGGMRGPSGKPYGAQSIKKMLTRS